MKEKDVSHPDDTPHTRRVRLPSGREIEVVYFDTGDLTTQDKQQKPKGQQELHICPECDRDRVYPVEWEEVSATEWEVLLRCPECEWTKVGVFDQATVDRFDEKLDKFTDELIDVLQELWRANTADEIGRFVRALDADAILPSDF
jgi:DNA-directed RNA polymerase subunit M/transcription elongation factor TFIIS